MTRRRSTFCRTSLKCSVQLLLGRIEARTSSWEVVNSPALIETLMLLLELEEFRLCTDSERVETERGHKLSRIYEDLVG